MSTPTVVLEAKSVLKEIAVIEQTSAETSPSKKSKKKPVSEKKSETQAEAEPGKRKPRSRKKSKAVGTEDSSQQQSSEVVKTGAKKQQA
jgi:hypothetical protein